MPETRLSPWGEDLSRAAGAHIAMLLTRNALGRGSANKARVQTVEIPRKAFFNGPDQKLIVVAPKTKPDTLDRTIENAKLVGQRVRGSQYGQWFEGRLNAGQATLDDVKAYAALTSSVGTGNCLEYAVVAFDKLVSDGWRSVELVQLAPPSTHCFVVLGSARAIGFYEGGFNLGNDAVICDPWARIACDARDYPSTWTAKMAKWEDEKKMIFANGEQIAPRQYGLQHRQFVMARVPDG
jgi:hypothetical protein